MIDVACAIILKEDKILVTQRSEKMSLPLKWEFPGGKIEHGEKADDCILREIKEELNIEIEIIEKLETKIFDYGNFSIKLVPFISNYVCGDLLLTEHKDSRWLSRTDLALLDWASADIPVLDTFLKTTHATTRTL
jgi:8-oxo-dGTP diphosphatase